MAARSDRPAVGARVRCTGSWCRGATGTVVALERGAWECAVVQLDSGQVTTLPLGDVEPC